VLASLTLCRDMPQFLTREAPYKKRPDAEAEWNTCRKGLNLLLRPTELGRDELAKADNIMLVGSGVPTGRWGTEVYFTANVTGSIRGFGKYKSNDGTTDEFFTLTDEGFLAKKNGSSYTNITGQSWPSGSTIHTEQLGGSTYIVSPDKEFTSYAGSGLTIFSAIGTPTGLYATNFSGATGSDRVSYKVVAIGQNGGQTLPSTNYVLASMPSELSDTEVHLFWTGPSCATMGGYEIYRGRQGDETLLAQINSQTTSYVDRGELASQLALAPNTNTTGGVKSNFIVKYKDRLLVVNADEPNKLLISGRYPYHTKFSWYDGGGYIFVDPDSGDNIKGIVVQPIADRIVVYKEYASYLVDIQTIQIGNYYILDPKYTPISTAVGCSSQDTIQTVENDSFYFGRNGVYVTGYEPNFLNIIRTNEVSAKMRPYLALLNETDYETACALYIDNKYILSFPQKKEMIVYDRERGAWLGPWKFPVGISHMVKYIDGSGNEKWILGSYESNVVFNFNSSVNSDNGTTISKTMRLNKEDFKEWTTLHIIEFFYFLFRNITGETTVNIMLEDKDGLVTTAKSFTISGAAVGGSTGWGMDKWGTVKYGQTNTYSFNVATDEISRWGTLFKQARYIQIEIVCNKSGSNFEFLKATATAKVQTRGALASSQRV
jgi:hypothetical protein